MAITAVLATAAGSMSSISSSRFGMREDSLLGSLMVSVWGCCNCSMRPSLACEGVPCLQDHSQTRVTPFERLKPTLT